MAAVCTQGRVRGTRTRRTGGHTPKRPPPPGSEATPGHATRVPGQTASRGAMLGHVSHPWARGQAPLHRTRCASTVSRGLGGPCCP